MSGNSFQPLARFKSAFVGEEESRTSTISGVGDQNSTIDNTEVEKAMGKRERIHYFLAKYVAPTARSEFRFFDDAKLQQRKNTEVDEWEKWLIPPAEDPNIPLRMIDVDTGDMVETRNYGPLDQYCILSHTWKGSEISYEYFTKGQRSTFRNKSNGGDVEALMNMSKENVHKKREELREILPEDKTIEDLLKDYFKLQEAEREYPSKAKKEEQAFERWVSAKWQAEYYRKYQRSLHRPKEVGVSENSDSVSGRLNKEIENLTSDAEKIRNETSIKRMVALEKLQKCENIRDFFARNRDIVYMIEDLLSALYFRKSAWKLKETVKNAKETFEKKRFGNQGRRYVWLDNCCINKADAGELNESLARMGEWYANASFCLVHIDTSPSNDEWIRECESPPRWESDASTRPNETGSAKVAHNFNELVNIETEIRWTTRGWTLQELVLSRMVYFFNADWEPLHRRVDDLGPYYYLAPFIKQYLALPSVECGDERVESPTVGPAIDAALQLTEGFREFRLEIPKKLERRTAAAHIGRMVYLAAETTTNREKSKPEDLGLSAPKHVIGSINSFLREFVTCIDDQIEKDRRNVQRIGRIQRLENWSDGTEPVNSSAKSIMTLASERSVTVPIDQVYSLMGILGVRFPVFPAEGLPKALCRLIDEVLVTSNDVSVFNWSGRYSGSPIRGRSLYPCNIEAFKNPIEVPSLRAQAEINKNIVAIFHDERWERAKLAKKGIKCLGKLMESIIRIDKKCSIVQKLHSLISSISKSATVEKLGAFRLDIDELAEQLDEINSRPIEEKKEEAKHIIKPIKTNLKLPSMSLTSDTSFRKPSFGFRAKKQEQTDNNASNEVVGPPQTQGLVVSADQKIAEEKKPEFSWLDLGGKVDELAKMIENIVGVDLAAKKRETELAEKLERLLKTNSSKETTENSQARKLAAELKSEGLLKKIRSKDVTERREAVKRLESAFSNLRLTAVQQESITNGRMVCSNPIIVTSAGIHGIFDVQRVVIEMEGPEKLRAKIYNAISGQKIEGSCTISTGFSRIFVGFTCEKEVLEQQLDVAEVIENKFLIAPEKLTPSMKEEQEGDNKPASEAKDATETESGNAQNRTASDQANPGWDFFEMESWSKEQKRTNRIIKFVQEDKLRAVAGEWVLARFSDVQGADWFLCRLELGPGEIFYARRIPTDGFSFQDGVPEAGLVDHWQNYMDEQKRMLCASTEASLNSKQQSLLVDEKMSSLDNAESTYSKVKTMTSGVKHSVSELWYEVSVQHLPEIEATAIKPVPSKLRQAVRSMEYGRHLFPTMYHSSVNIHMF